MNVYLVRFAGHYLGAEIVVVAETQRKAFNSAKKEIAHLGLTSENEDLAMEDVELIDVSKPSVILIDNGDY